MIISFKLGQGEGKRRLTRIDLLILKNHRTGRMRCRLETDEP